VEVGGRTEKGPDAKSHQGDHGAEPPPARERVPASCDRIAQVAPANGGIAGASGSVTGDPVMGREAHPIHHFTSWCVIRATRLLFFALGRYLWPQSRRGSTLCCVFDTAPDDFGGTLALGREGPAIAPGFLFLARRARTAA
jgi:hypothetical protein